MKKRIIAVIVILAVLVALFFIGTGFQKRMDVVLVDYSVSEDGTEITLDVGIPTSIGYIRGFKDNGSGVKPHYLTFFSTFGGINSPIGAEHSFQLELTSDDTEIYFNRPEGGYELILVKDEETEYCSDCSRQKHVYDQACALYEYSKNVKESIYRFKYYNKQEYAGIYAKQMADRCGRMIRMWSPDVIIPVPIHISKYKERGFNQAGLIAQALGRAMQIPVDEEYLVRIVKTQPMKELSNRERIKNLQNAFQVRGKVVRYRKVLIVDDIYTTGATFDACAAVLKDAGVSQVYGISLCVGDGF